MVNDEDNQEEAEETSDGGEKELEEKASDLEKSEEE